MPTELSVLVENRPGSLAEITDILTEQDVNVEAIMLEGSLDFGVARLQVDAPRVAETALASAGLQVTTGDVIVLDLPNEPGELSRICHELEKVDVNIEYVFGSTSRAEDSAELILKTSNQEAARRILGVGD